MAARPSLFLHVLIFVCSRQPWGAWGVWFNAGIRDFDFERMFPRTWLNGTARRHGFRQLRILLVVLQLTLHFFSLSFNSTSPVDLRGAAWPPGPDWQVRCGFHGVWYPDSGTSLFLGTAGYVYVSDSIANFSIEPPLWRSFPRLLRISRVTGHQEPRSRHERGPGGAGGRHRQAGPNQCEGPRSYWLLRLGDRCLSVFRRTRSSPGVSTRSTLPVFETACSTFFLFSHHHSAPCRWHFACVLTTLCTDIGADKALLPGSCHCLHQPRRRRPEWARGGRTGGGRCFKLARRATRLKRLVHPRGRFELQPRYVRESPGTPAPLACSFRF